MNAITHLSYYGTEEKRLTGFECTIVHFPGQSILWIRIIRRISRCCSIFLEQGGCIVSFSYDHDKFVAKNRALASAERIKQKDDALEKKGYSYLKRDQEASCFNCKMKSTCPTFRGKRSGGAAGVVSFGGEQSFVCERFIPAPAQDRNMSNKQIKSLLKNAKKGFR